MAVKYTNNAATTLNGNINDSTTSIVVASDPGFPTVGGADYAYMTLVSGSNIEIIKVTAITSLTLTCVRAQDGTGVLADTTGYAFVTGDACEVRLCRATLVDALAESATPTGAAIKLAYEAEANAFTDAQFTKLAGIDTSAADDQTGAEIKSAYEGEADTNAYDDAAVSKLAAIEAAADVTDATNVAAATAVMEGDTTTATMDFVLDEDAMGSDSATKLATQQSIKAYVDSVTGSGAGAMVFIETQVASADSTIDFTSSISTAYAKYVVILADVLVSTNTADMFFRFGDSSGVDSGAADYAYHTRIDSPTQDAPLRYVRDTAANHLLIFDNIGNGSAEGFNSTIDVYLGDGVTLPKASWVSVGDDATSGNVTIAGSGTRAAGIVMDRVQFIMNSGTITSGRFSLYGIKHA